MPWSDYPLRTLTLPQTAGPNDSSIVIGPDIPPELQTYYAGLMTAVVLWRRDGNDYTYMGVTTAAFVCGVCDSGTVAELFTLGGNGLGEAFMDWGALAPYNLQFGGSFSTVLLACQTAGVSFNTDWTIDGISQGRGCLGANITNNGTVVTTPGGGGETAVPSAQWDTEPTYDLANNRIFMALAFGGAWEPTGGSQLIQARLRKGQATVVGTTLAYHNMTHPPGFGGLVNWWVHPYFFKNTSGGLVQTKLSLTVSGPGGATCSLYGDNPGQLGFAVFDIGSAVQQGFVVDLVSV